MVFRKQPDLPSEVAEAFVRDAVAYFAEPDRTKRDAIAAFQLKVLLRYQAAGEKPLRLSDVKVMFEQMRDQATG